MCKEIRNTSLNDNFTLVLSVPVYTPALVLIWSVYYMEKDICYYYQVLFPAENVATNGILTVPVYFIVDTSIATAAVSDFLELGSNLWNWKKCAKLEKVRKIGRNSNRM